MKIHAGFEIDYDCSGASPLMLMLSVRPERQPDLITPDTLRTSVGAPVHQYVDGFGNICSRVTAPPGLITLSADFLVQDSGEPDRIVPNAIQHEIADLPDDTLVYLLGSRYCETDHMSNLAWNAFAGVPAGWARVQAIVDYTHQQITFGYAHARATRTAHEAHGERLGVCRDFAHLAITLCRCMNIPARYCTGYLGDIGVPPVEGPMDFSAWFEVFLGGAWHTFDARHNRPRIGRILMARGRDATDVAIATTFGPTRLARFTVVTDEVAQ